MRVCDLPGLAEAGYRKARITEAGYRRKCEPATPYWTVGRPLLAFAPAGATKSLNVDFVNTRRVSERLSLAHPPNV